MSNQISTITIKIKPDGKIDIKLDIQPRRPKFEPKLLTMRVSNLGLKFGGPTSGREWQTTFHVFTHTPPLSRSIHPKFQQNPNIIHLQTRLISRSKPSSRLLHQGMTQFHQLCAKLCHRKFGRECEKTPFLWHKFRDT